MGNQPIIFEKSISSEGQVCHFSLRIDHLFRPTGLDVGFLAVSNGFPWDIDGSPEESYSYVYSVFYKNSLQIAAAAAGCSGCAEVASVIAPAARGHLRTPRLRQALWQLQAPAIYGRQTRSMNHITTSLTLILRTRTTINTTTQKYSRTSM